MTLEPGDETHRHGDYVPRVVDKAVNPGTPVMPGSGGSDVALTSGSQYLGVLQNGGFYQDSYGQDKSNVKVQGTVLAYVASGAKDGDHLGSPDTANGEPEGAFGTKDDQDVVALEDAYEYENTGNYVAEVLLR